MKNTLRISYQTEKRIIELWFRGLPRDAIARRTAVSGSTVSKVINQLPECLRELRKLSVELRRSKASPSEALKGAKMLSKLSTLGVELEQLPNFIQAVKKLSRKAGYQPKQVVKAAMELSDLEEKSGKRYHEAIKEFEVKTKQTRKLKKKTLDLQREIENKKEQRKQKLKQNKITEKEIKYVKSLRQKLCIYGISLIDVENLDRYLKNMKETGGNPRKFVKLTRKCGSLKGRLTSLENQKQQKIQKLDGIEKKIEPAEDELSILRIALLELRKEKHNIIQELGELKKELDQQRTRLETSIVSLSEILRVRAEVAEINKAIEAKNRELTGLETAVSNELTKRDTLNSEVDELERKKESLEHEVENTLKIKNYAVEIKEIITDLEQQKSLLEKEMIEKKERIALADTITKFLTRQPTRDFNQLYSMVKDVKRIREDKSSPVKPLLPRIEEKIRMQALEAFKGDLVSKSDFSILAKRNEKIRERNIELNTKVTQLGQKFKMKDDQLVNIEKKYEILKRLSVNFEGRQVTLKELFDWTKSILEKEIERRTSEKFDEQAARTSALLNFLYEKCAR